MSKRNEINSSTVRITKTVKQEAEKFVGNNPLPYTSLSKLNDDALRTHVNFLKKQYPELKSKKGESKK